VLDLPNAERGVHSGICPVALCFIDIRLEAADDHASALNLWRWGVRPEDRGIFG